MNADDALIPAHGGFRKLKSFQISRLVYDVTVRFCEAYIPANSRTRDQMVQAARSGVQNIAEGSQCSGTSKKFELKLTGVARASLEELRLDYEDFLRQKALPVLDPGHPALVRFKALRCATLLEFRRWVGWEHGRTRTGTDLHGQERSQPEVLASVSVRASPCPSVSPTTPEVIPVPALVANGALSLLNLAGRLLDRQLAAQAGAFAREGGFTERLYQIRSRRRAG